MAMHEISPITEIIVLYIQNRENMALNERNEAEDQLVKATSSDELA